MSRYRSFVAGAAVALLAASFVSPAFARGPGSDHGNGRSAEPRPEHSYGNGQGNGHGRDKVRPAPTKMDFKLDQHHFESGSTVSAVATLYTRSGKAWVPLDGALLQILVDGVEVGVGTTMGGGKLFVDWGGATDGDHVMKIVYAGDATHKKAQRAQGFQVGSIAEEEEIEEIEEALEPAPGPVPVESVP